LSVETNKETGMRTIEPEELKTILEKHKLWLDGQDGGERANLVGANLVRANLDGPTSSGPTSSWPTSSGPTSPGPTSTGPTSSGPTSTGPTLSSCATTFGPSFPRRRLKCRGCAAEAWFTSIRPGQTPAEHNHVTLTLEWVDDWLGRIRSAIPSLAITEASSGNDSPK
jgi:hypothetical protein